MIGEHVNKAIKTQKVPWAFDHLYRLIEYDEGIPFQLMFSEEGEGHYILLGTGIEKLTGLKASLVTERGFYNMVEVIEPITANIPSDLVQLRQRVLDGDVDEYRIEMKLKAGPGKNIWVRETAIPLKDDSGGKVTGITGIYHDVTERRKAKASLEEANEKAFENERLKTIFLQNISHEVRTPLNAIVGFSTMLCEPEEYYYPKEEFVHMLNNSTDHFLEVMDNIMEISRIEAGSSQVNINETDPARIAERMVRIFSPLAAARGLVLTCSYDANGSHAIMTDSYKLSQILNYLLDNALKFTFSGSIEFGYEFRGNCIEFFVSDTGIGIPDAHIPHVFNKFYQAESDSTRRFSGVGLGLTIARSYVDLLGGNIDFISSEGKGSIFRFSLPVNGKQPEC